MATTSRASWKGYVKLALASCPVRLYKATGQAERLASHFLHRETRNRIQMVPYDSVLGKVARSDLVTGYAHDGDRHVVLTDADLAEIKTPSDKTLLIETFVDAGDIDPLYFDQPYYLAPDGPVAIEMVDVLRTVMGARNKAALARIVMNRRERLAALSVRGRGIVLTTLRNADEVRDPQAFFADLPSGDPSTELTNLAEQLIAMRSGRFDPHMFKDRYQAALRALIEQKAAYGETADESMTAAPAHIANDDEVQAAANLAEAFRRSVDAQRKPPAKSRSRKTSKKPAPARKPRVTEKTPG